MFLGERSNKMPGLLYHNFILFLNLFSFQKKNMSLTEQGKYLNKHFSNIKRKGGKNLSVKEIM